MRQRHILIASVLLALAVAYWLWPQSDSASDKEETLAADSSAIEKRREARRSGEVSNAPASISGRVLSMKDKEPIEGALVSIALRKIDGGLMGQAGQSAAPLAARTDAAGKFKIEKLTPGRYSISTTMRGYRPTNVEGLLIEGGQDLEGVELLLEEGGHLVTGQVTDIGGGPVGFAFVRARKISEFTLSSFFRAPLTAATDAEGMYELNLDDGNYAFEVFHEDYRTEKKTRSVGGQDRRVDFVLTPGSVIEGTVLLAGEGTPVVGATVTWSKMGQARGFVLSGVTINSSAQTDSQGKFSLRGLGSGALELRAYAAHSSSREATIVELSIAETVSDVVVYVDNAFMVSGFVVNKGSEREAAGDVMLGAYNISPGALYSASQPSASDGYFEIHGVPPGSFTVGALAEEKLPNFFGEAITVVDQDLTDVVVFVDGGYTLRGTVDPPQIATLTLEVNMKEVGFSNIMQAAGSFLVRTRSAADGSFALKGVNKGSYTLVAKAESGSQGRLEVHVDGDSEGLRIEMEERASASGIVVDSRGKPVEGVEVRFDSQVAAKAGSFRFGGPNADGSAAMTGPDGSFREVGLEDGSFEVTVQAGAGSQLSWAGKSGDAGREPIIMTIKDGADLRNLRLEVEARTHTISGSVQDPEGAPLPDAWVTAQRVADVGDSEDTDGQEKKWRRRWNPTETPVLTNSDGDFEIVRLRSGLYDISAEASRGGAKGEVERVKTDTRVNIRIEKLGKLSGTVTQAGAPVKDYILEVKGPQRRRIHVARDNGSFNLPRLESGDYSMEVTSSKGVASAKATVVAGEETVAAIKLASFGTITGVLLDAATGDPIPKMSAVATMDRDRSKNASNAIELITGVGPSTGEEGEFRVGKLGAGEGTIYFMDPKAKGFSPVAQEKFSLKPGETLDLGDIYGTRANSVPEDKRGTLGMKTAVAINCPANSDDQDKGESDPTDEGKEEQAKKLWITSIEDGGPAAAAGAKLCDQITAVGGMPGSQIGATLLQQVLTRGLEAGTTVTISVTRDAGPTTLSIQVGLEAPEEPEDP